MSEHESPEFCSPTYRYQAYVVNAYISGLSSLPLEVQVEFAEYIHKLEMLATVKLDAWQEAAGFEEHIGLVP